MPPPSTIEFVITAGHSNEKWIVNHETNLTLDLIESLQEMHYKWILAVKAGLPIRLQGISRDAVKQGIAERESHMESTKR